MREGWRGTGVCLLSPTGQLRVGQEGELAPPPVKNHWGVLKHQSATMFAEPWLCRKRRERRRIFFTLLSSLKRLRLENRVGCLAIDLEIKPFFCTSRGVFARLQCSASFLEQCCECACATEPEMRLQLLWPQAIKLGGGQQRSHSSLVFWVCCRFPLGAQGNICMTKLSQVLNKVLIKDWGMSV